MVAQLIRLRLALLSNIFSGTRRRALGVTVGLLLATTAVVSVCLRIADLAGEPSSSVRTAVVLSGSAVVAAFLLVPMLFQRSDAMDPRRFAGFGFASRSLAFALVASSIVALPVVAAALFTLSAVVAWSQNAGVAFVALMSGVLGLATCVLLGRLSSSLAAYLLSSRRAREVAGTVGVFVLVILAPAAVLLLSINWGAEGATWAQRLAGILGVTPVGAAWTIPAALAEGDGAGALISFVIAAATVAVLWAAWQLLTTSMLTSTRREDESSEPSALGWFGRLPSTPSATIAARSLTYWSRDPRYWVPLLIVPVVPIVMAVPLVLVSFPLSSYALIPLPVMCLFLAFMVHNDISLDNSAVWLHVVSGRRGVADRLGRVIPVILIGIPLIGVGSVVTVLLANNSSALPSVLGVSTCVLLSTLGLGNLISARFPYAATRPGDSPFTQPQSTGSTSVFVQVAVVVGTLALTLPSIAYAVAAQFGDSEAHWSSLWSGVGVGLLVFILGTLGGGALFNRRGPEILATTLRG
ncbi:ABC transporter permease [Subtercola frigoramans]|uniref:ABC-2 type transport system permease protein n=1 Tax=Subtercola frigoramans TaxID=120298 RepID=A0ABS2L414_9MICO|nr:ABC transporter permease [Subtercola frigoramans]MBM7471812.1 ABC-2 type transport system permease protein [Subtercola frigoramans]